MFNFKWSVVFVSFFAFCLSGHQFNFNNNNSNSDYSASGYSNLAYSDGTSLSAKAPVVIQTCKPYPECEIENSEVQGL